MNEINDFISFIFNNINDDRFDVNKTVTNGHRIYTIGIHIEEEDKPISKNAIYSYNNVVLTIDTGNKYILLNVNMDEVLIENSELTMKWAKVFEDYLNSQIDHRVKRLISNALAKSDLSREYKINRLL